MSKIIIILIIEYNMLELSSLLRRQNILNRSIRLQRFFEVELKVVGEQHVENGIGDRIRVGERRDGQVDELDVRYERVAEEHDRLKDA